MNPSTPPANILIAGLAKTGTTILFSRVRASLPEPAQTFFEPANAEALRRILHIGQARPTLTKCLVGQIVADTPGLLDFTHHVLIVRDPRDQLVSEMLYDFFKFLQNQDSCGYTAARNLLHAKVRRPGSISCTQLFHHIRALAVNQQHIKSPVQLLAVKFGYLEAYRKAVNPFIVRYEDIIDNRLEPLAAHLGLDRIQPAEVDPDVRRVRRSGTYGEWKQWFTPDDLREFDTHLGPLMTRHGYPPEPLPSPQRIPSKTSLHYIRQFNPRPASPLTLLRNPLRLRKQTPAP